MSLSKVKTRDYPLSDAKRGINYVKSITNNYTVREEDKGWLIVINVAGATTITIPPLSVPVGSQVDFFRMGAGTVTFASSGNAVLRAEGNVLATSNTGATLIKISDTDYLLVGKLTV